MGSGSSPRFLRLQYDNGHPTFSDGIKSFRKNYQTPFGLPGADLHDWSSSLHQAALEEMADVYLEKEGNGNLYWPDDSTSANFNTLRYSRDHSKIKTLMKQLMFRLNQQHYRNHKYKGKERLSMNETHERGRSLIDPINVDGFDAKSNNPFGSHPGVWPKVNSAETRGTSVVSPATSDTAQGNPISTGTSSGTLCSKDPNEDIFIVPLAPEPLLSSKQRRITTLHFPSRSTEAGAEKTTILKRTANLEDSSREATTSKRTKAAMARIDSDILYSNSKSTTKKASKITDSRISPRGRKLRQIPIPDYRELVREAIESPISSETSDTGIIESQESPEKVATDNVRGAHVAEFVQDMRPQSPTEPLPGQPPLRDVPDAAGVEPMRTKSPLASAPHRPQPATPVVGLSTPTLVDGPQSGTSEVPGCQAIPARSSLPPKPTPSFVYTVVLSRTPILRTERWQPKGKFQDKTLEEVFLELTLDQNVEGLAFTLKGPGLHSKDQIDRNDEANFAEMKTIFSDQIKACVAHHMGSQTPLRFVFELEPLRSMEQATDTDTDATAKDLDIGW